MWSQASFFQDLSSQIITIVNKSVVCGRKRVFPRHFQLTHNISLIFSDITFVLRDNNRCVLDMTLFVTLFSSTPGLGNLVIFNVSP